MFRKKLILYIILRCLILKTFSLECYRSPGEKEASNFLVDKFKSFLKSVADKYASIPGDDLNTPQIIEREGYPVEIHRVKTEDGYILTLHRIPGSGPAVLVQHGILADSSSFVLTGKNKALAFLLADQNYDVWMGNFRGSIYSCHESISKTDSKFWDFSWHEMAIYDLPSFISYITNIGNDKIFYVGHSMGTTAFYSMASLLPKMSDKIIAMFGLAPIAFLTHMKGFLRPLATFRLIIKAGFDLIGKHDFLTLTENHKLLARFACDLTTLQEKACSTIFFVLFGFDADLYNTTLTPALWNHEPAGTSTKTLIHFGQSIILGHFRQFDYGESLNKIKYNSTEPPDYDLSKIKIPIGLLYGENDYLSRVEDVERLKKSLPNVILDYKVPYPKFEHVDFLWGIDAAKLVYNKLISAMNDFKHP